MGVSVDEVVRRTIRHVERIAKDGRYEWPTARSALTAIMADLEGRHPGDPALELLRRYIARGDYVWSRRNGSQRN
ncbi:MAG: hypothetical protein JO288_09800 [Hyphomicrobiales bacterium]|nr:hypothetical protein [Hyphomicrobiales bacterium]